MKLSFHSSNVLRDRRGSAGIMLFECLIYIGVFFVVLALAFGAMHRTWFAHNALRRNAGDIVTALQAGEQWRADIRRASAPLESRQETDDSVVSIPCGHDTITYRFASNTVTRLSTAQPARIVLRNVASSQVSRDLRANVTAWRWDIEFKSTRKTPKMRPLFTFIAVPAGAKP